MSLVGSLQKRLRRRKKFRDRKRRLKQGHRARREARAVRRLRAWIRRLLNSPKTQWDSVVVQNIPHGAAAVAGYVDGIYANVAPMKAAHPKARMTTIAISKRSPADCLDIEPGCADTEDAPVWFHMMRQERPERKPIFYTFASNTANLIATLDRAGIKRKDYILWIAHWTNRHVCSPAACGYPKADATQWTTHGETVDESKCRPSYWNRGR